VCRPACAVFGGFSADWAGTVLRVTRNYFDEQVAATYDDDDEGGMFASGVVDPAADFLAALAGDGAALEFAVGTGRIALPLSRRGVRVHGIDLSEAMVARLANKPGADQVQVTIGDIATTRVPGTFRLVYLVFNTIMNLTTQDAQVDCFRNAAAHLQPGGCFVIEVMVPQLQRLPPGETFQPFDVTAAHVGFDEYDVVTQAMASHHYTAEADGRMRYSCTPFRYGWPSEFDLMARIAGLRLRGRWASWQREPFTAESSTHVSVWEKTAT
jgi:SAM-dependent methyltransferase